jgi:hypothetical protein
MFLSCWCDQTKNYYHSLTDGNCRADFKQLEICSSNIECLFEYSLCMDIYGEGVKRCVPLPNAQLYKGYRRKLSYGYTGCSETTFRCNEWDNLICQRSGSSSSTCQCLDDSYYYNSTKCIIGKIYGDHCSSSAQCTPTTAALTCDLPYTGAIYTATKTCLALKALNSTCRDSSECSGGAANTMFCGEWEGGSIQVCLCTDAYYPSGTTCVAKLVYNDVCSSSNQCLSHLNQTCLANNNKCGCASGKYFSSSDTTCKQLKYYRDSCSSGNECWSGTCTLSLCT